MLDKPLKISSMILKVAIGKIVGLCVGIMVVISLREFMPDLSLMLQTGMVLWYVTLGTMISLFGVPSESSRLNFSKLWWLRSFSIGGWMHFVLTFFIYDNLYSYITAVFSDYGYIPSPFWFSLQGAFIALIMLHLIVAIEERKLPRYGWWIGKSK